MISFESKTAYSLEPLLAKSVLLYMLKPGFCSLELISKTYKHISGLEEVDLYIHWSDFLLSVVLADHSLLQVDRNLVVIYRMHCPYTCVTCDVGRRSLIAKHYEHEHCKPLMFVRVQTLDENVCKRCNKSA